MIKRYFRFDELGTTYKQEILAGATTFATMAYIVIVNPKILQAAGIPFGASLVATIISAFFGTLTMGIYAKRPFAIAPYMGENAFIAFTVVKILGYRWETAIGAIFIGGVIFTLITIFKIRSWLAKAIPEGLKVAFAVGIGLFLTFIGLNETGIVKLGVPGAPVHIGKLSEPSIILALIGFIVIIFLMIKKIRGSMLIGILFVTILAYIFKVQPLPEKWISMPPSLSPTFLKLDIAGALQFGFISVILTVFVMDFVDTLGSLIGLSYKANLLDEDGNLPEIEKPMLCDALATVVGALLGTTTSGVYIESAAGIEEGGKSGFTAIVTAFLFLITLFFAPFIGSIPKCAYGPALIIVGMLMISPILRVNFDDLTEIVPIFMTIVLMSFTYNLGIGITAGFIIYPIVKIFKGKIKEIHVGLWILTGISILFYIFYPYG